LATLDSDTIVAVATPPGQGGIGVIRLSGSSARTIGTALTNTQLQPRVALRVKVFEGDELQVHGSPVVLQKVLQLCCAQGARLARPGEFSERAFLNEKIDLAQAEAIADLIASASQNAARAAVRALSGEFSRRVSSLAKSVERMRVLVEATIDFPEEEEDFLAHYSIPEQLIDLRADLSGLIDKSGQGRRINEGVSIALIGAPNVGKSSLLNRLSGEDTAIVTDIPGTTRDLLKVDLVLADLPVRIVDTAGLRESSDPVEREGVARAQTEAAHADVLVCLIDGTTQNWRKELEGLLKKVGWSAESGIAVLPTVNKGDLLTAEKDDPDFVTISAKTGAGITRWIEALRGQVGLTSEVTEFTARRRHVEALQSAASHLERGQAQLQNLELLAEELRSGHDALGEIVGRTTPDDLLGKIFSEFCIGK
jgi:tRNA modification GTPase